MILRKVKDFFVLLIDIIYLFFVTFVADIFGWDVRPGGINYGTSGSSWSGGGGARVGGSGANNPRNLRGLGRNVSYRGGAGGS